MKAAVMESNNGRSIVLTDDGVFTEIDGEYKAGEVIDLKEWEPAAPVRAHMRMRTLRRIAAAACLVLAMTAGILSLKTPDAYACVELGDGYCVRYYLDEDLKVIDVEASESSGNDLARDLLSDGVRGKDINEAISMAEERTGIIYDASSEPPEIRCKDGSAAEEITNDIREHHSAGDKTDQTEDLHYRQAPAVTQEAENAFNDSDRQSKENKEIGGSKNETHESGSAKTFNDNGNGEPHGCFEEPDDHRGGALQQ